MDETRVFLADDHVMVREGLALLLNDHVEIRVVGQCGEGLEVRPMVERLDPDVIVLDITMPGLNGLDLCRELIQLKPEMGILMLTMHRDEEFIRRALKAGAKGYLIKDSAAEKLAEAVRTVAAGEVYLGPGIRGDLLEELGRRSDPYDRLSTRERQVLQLIAEGMTNRQISQTLGLAVKTVDTHRTRLMRKLNIHDQTSLVKYAIRKGIITVR